MKNEDITTYAPPAEVILYWNSLLYFMPAQFHTHEVASLRSFTIHFYNKESKVLQIQCYCSVRQSVLDGEEDELQISFEFIKDVYNKVGAQLKFKLNESSRTLKEWE